MVVDVEDRATSLEDADGTDDRLRFRLRFAEVRTSSEGSFRALSPSSSGNPITRRVLLAFVYYLLSSCSPADNRFPRDTRP